MFGATYKKGKSGRLKDSDLALPEGSIAKRRGLKVGKELTKWVPLRPLTPTTRLAIFQ
jgi:hypothetical protein